MVETTFKGKVVTQAAVISALESFASAYPDPNAYKELNTQKGWLENDAYHHAIDYQNRLYPPKHILREITGIHVFSGGLETNRVFRDLGFEIVQKNQE